LKIAYKIFKSEIKDLLAFYNCTISAYSQLRKLNKEPLQNENTLNDIDFIYYNKRLEYELRELLLVKLVSILEKYLTDNVKFIFMESKVPFKTNNFITFQHQELLSFKSLTEVHSKLISKESRQLSNGGLDKIIKYYNSKFKLNLNSFFPSKERIIEYHERRHLYVHNLGKTDKKYRKKYETNKIGLSTSDEYIKSAIEDISAFGEIVNKNTLNYLENINVLKKTKKNIRNIWFSFQYLSEKLELIEDEYGFWSNDDLVIFKDILLEKKHLPDNFIEIKIQGENLKIKDYYKIFRTTSRNNPQIKFLNKLFDDYKAPEYPKIHKLYISPTPKVIITEELIENVEKQLTDEPWETGIHKKIAINLNQSNKTISRIIKIILERRKENYS
jgi:hypothetical protein